MVTPVRGTSTRAAQAERTRQQILETAQRLFADRGYDATSLQMIADEMGLTKAAVYYHFPAKSEILKAAMRPGIERMNVLLDEAAQMRGRRARIEHLVNGYADILVMHRPYSVMASTDPAAKRHNLSDEGQSMRRRALALVFGENPTGNERISFNAIFSIHEYLPELVDLSDEELRDAVRTTVLHILRVPS
jgi:AcrR family transcriptional regulator